MHGACKVILDEADDGMEKHGATREIARAREWGRAEREGGRNGRRGGRERECV